MSDTDHKSKVRIRITSEMIKAGVACISGHPYFHEPTTEEIEILVRDVFAAMAAVK